MVEAITVVLSGHTLEWDVQGDEWTAEEDASDKLVATLLAAEVVVAKSHARPPTLVPGAT
jgi:hypothetical protein